MADPLTWRAFFKYAILVICILAGAAALADLVYPEIPADGVIFKDVNARPIEILKLEKGSFHVGKLKVDYFSTSPVPGGALVWLPKIESNEKLRNEGATYDDPPAKSDIGRAVDDRKGYDILREHPGVRPALYLLQRGVSNDKRFAWYNGPGRPWYDIAGDDIRFVITIAIILFAFWMVRYAPQLRVFVLGTGLVLFGLSAFPLNFVWITYVFWIPQKQQVEIAEALMRYVHPFLANLAIFLLGLFVLVFSGKRSAAATALAVAGFAMAISLSAAYGFFDYKDLYTAYFHNDFFWFSIFSMAWWLLWLLLSYVASRRLSNENLENQDIKALGLTTLFIVSGVAVECLYYFIYFNYGSYERAGSLRMALLGLFYLTLPIGTCWVLAKRGLIRVASRGLIVLAATTAIGVVADIVKSKYSKQFGDGAASSTLIASFLVLVALPQTQQWLTNSLRAMLKDPTSQPELDKLRAKLEAKRSLEDFAQEAVAYVRNFTHGAVGHYFYVGGASDPVFFGGDESLRHEDSDDFFAQLRQAERSDEPEGTVALSDAQMANVALLRDRTRCFGSIVYVPTSSAWASDPGESLPAAVVDTIATAALKNAYLDSAEVLKHLILEGQTPSNLAGFARISATRIIFQTEEGMAHFVVVRERGPAWNWGLPMREQLKWTEHAAFMDALTEKHFILAGGPLGSEDEAKRVLHVVVATDTATVEMRLNEDPWSSMDLLKTVSIEPWTVLLGGFA